MHELEYTAVNLLCFPRATHRAPSLAGCSAHSDLDLVPTLTFISTMLVTSHDDTSPLNDEAPANM